MSRTLILSFALLCGCGSEPVEGFYDSTFDMKFGAGCDDWGMNDESMDSEGLIVVQGLDEDGNFSLTLDGTGVFCQGGGSFFCKTDQEFTMYGTTLAAVISVQGHFVEDGIKGSFRESIDCHGDDCGDAEHCTVHGSYEGELTDDTGGYYYP